MRRQPLGRAHLIFPTKSTGTVGRKFHVIRRVRINKIVRLNLKRLNIAIRESPVFEDTPKLRKVRCVGDCRVSAERYIEFAALIKPAKTIEASAIQIIEELRCLGSL